MTVLEFLKWLVLLALGTPVALLRDWRETRRLRQRLRVINAVRAASGQPPLSNLWEALKEQPPP